VASRGTPLPPLALVGGVLGFFARRGNLRVGSISLNALAFLPAAALAVMFLAGVTVDSIRSVKKSLPPSHSLTIGQEIVYGDLGITVTRARVQGFTFVVALAFKNRNPNRIVRAGSQVDAAELKDDVGNTHKGMRDEIDGQIPPGKVRPIRSDESLGDVLVFDRPLPGASVLYLTLDAEQYGGSGRILVTITKAEWTNEQRQNARPAPGASGAGGPGGGRPGGRAARGAVGTDSKDGERMRQSERVKLLAGPYHPPALRRGDVATCLYRDCDVVVLGWTDARISWPLCKRREGRSGPGLLVDEELARAIRTESAAALRYWWGVGVKLVWQWRHAFAIGRAGTPGSTGSSRPRHRKAPTR
jgi:hypothetical protein